MLEALQTGLVKEAERRIASHREVQPWLQQRVQVAAGEMMAAQDVHAFVDTQGALEDELRRTFPNLAAAVRSTTAGTASLVVDWSPEAPQRSAIRIKFNTPIQIDVLRLLPALEPRAVAEMLEEVSDRMPKTKPFVGHPHVLGVMTIHEGKPLALQIIDQLHDNQRSTWLRLLPRDVEVRGRIPIEQGGEALVEYFSLSPSQ